MSAGGASRRHGVAIINPRKAERGTAATMHRAREALPRKRRSVGTVHRPKVKRRYAAMPGQKKVAKRTNALIAHHWD
jgi:hypothetical protein